MLVKVAIRATTLDEWENNIIFWLFTRNTTLSNIPNDFISNKSKLTIVSTIDNSRWGESPWPRFLGSLRRSSCRENAVGILKKEDFEESTTIEKVDIKEKDEDIVSDTKNETSFESISTCETANTSTKRRFSDIDEECDKIDDTKKKKRKETFRIRLVIEKL